MLIFEFPFFSGSKLGFVSGALEAYSGEVSSRIALGPHRPQLSEMAVPWVCNVDTTGLTCRNEPDSDDLGHLGAAFVPYDMHVVSTGVDEPHSHRVDMGFTLWIVAFVCCYRSGGDGNQRVAGMTVPACVSSRLPDIALHVQV